MEQLHNRNSEHKQRLCWGACIVFGSWARQPTLRSVSVLHVSGPECVNYGRCLLKITWHSTAAPTERTDALRNRWEKEERENTGWGGGWVRGCTGCHGNLHSDVSVQGTRRKHGKGRRVEFSRDGGCQGHGGRWIFQGVMGSFSERLRRDDGEAIFNWCHT